MQKLPQLTLRDLFWLVLVVGMALGWFVHQRRLSKALDEANEQSDYIWLRTQHFERSLSTLIEALKERGLTVQIGIKTGEATVDETPEFQAARKASRKSKAELSD